MILEDIFEISLMGAFDRGVPNKERICIKANTKVNMGQFGVLLGIQQHSGTAVPINDLFFWFGDGWVYEGDWIFLYSGPGKSVAEPLPGNDGRRIYTFHWGRDRTLLNSPEIVPILFRMNEVTVNAQHQSAEKSLLPLFEHQLNEDNS